MNTNKGNMGVMVAVIIILVIAAGALYMTSSLGMKQADTTANTDTQSQEMQYAADDTAQLEAEASADSGADDIDSELNQLDAELGVQVQ